MTTADKLIDKIFSWLDKQEQCAKKLEDLAAELESFRKNIQITQVIGSSVSVAGAAALTGAGILTLCTGGAAVPLLLAAGSVSGVLGTATNLGSDIVEAFKSSSTMEEAKKTAEESTDLMNEIQKLIESLVEEGEEQKACVFTEDSLEDYLMDYILKALAERSGLKWNDNYKLLNTISDVTKNMESKMNPAVSRKAAALVLPLLTQLIITMVAEKILTAVAEKTAKSVLTTTAKTTAKATAKATAKTTAKATAKATIKTTAKGIGRVGGGVVGLAFSVPELVMDSIELAKGNCETEGSKALRDAAEKMKTNSEQMKRELDRVRELFERLAKVKRCTENPESDSEERKEFKEFAKEQCKDEATQRWLEENSEFETFFKLLRMFLFLIDEEEKKDHSEDIDIIFVAHGSIEDDMMSASRLMPVETVRDVVLYSPWNCAITAKAAYRVATGKMKPQRRRFYRCKEACCLPRKRRQHINLPNHWNFMKKAGDQQIPNIVLSPLGPKDGAWERFRVLKNKHGLPKRNRIVVPYILPGDGSPSSGVVPFFIVTLALSLVLLFSRFRATVHLTACLGKSSKREKFDETQLKRQYAYTVDDTRMTASAPLSPDPDLYRALKAVFD